MTNEKLRELFWQERARLLALIEACESEGRFMELAAAYRPQSDAASALVAAPPGAEQCRDYLARGEKLAAIADAVRGTDFETHEPDGDTLIHACDKVREILAR